MISTSDLYEAGFVSSDHDHYIEFSKYIGGWTIDITNEVDGDIVTKQYAELGLSGYFDKINLQTIEDVKALEKILTYEKP